MVRSRGVWILRVKYSKVTNAEIKWSIISKFAVIVFIVEFIDQLIDYPINRASLTKKCQILIEQYLWYLN